MNYHHRRKEVTRSKRRKHKDNTEKESRKKRRKDKDEADGTEEVAESSSGSGEAQTATSPDDIWKGPAKLPDEKSREEEFEEYLEDLFL